jgi:hypothetical protein
MSIVDVLVYVHPELPAADRAKVRQAVLSKVGVVEADFDQHKHPHALIVQYKPDIVQSAQILDVVRQFDAQADLVGL